MEDRSNMKNPTRSYAYRGGNAQLVGILMVIGALCAAAVAGYALWSLIQGPQSGQTQNPSDVGLVDPMDGNQGSIAATESIEEILGAVQVYVRNNQNGQALTVLEHAVAQYVQDQELRFALGDLYMIEGRHRDAYGQYIAGIEIGPSTAVAEFTAGTLANMLDMLEVAEMHYSKSMGMDPTNPDTPVFLAAIQIKMNQLVNAKINLAIAGKLAPENARIFAMRSEIALRENKLNIALDQIRKARAIDPDSLGWVLQEARVLKRDRKPEEAINLMTALPEDQLEVVEAAMILAECYGMLGRPGDAASRLIDVAKKNPNDGKLAFDVALWLERAGERADAIAWATKAKTLGHANAQSWIESLN